MYISKLNAYIEAIDPYYTQRLILRKGLYIAILMVVAYVLFQPKEGFAFIIAPFLGYFIFEIPAYNTYKKKYAALIFSYGSALCFSCLFILVSPYQWALFVTGVVSFFLFLFLTIKYLPQFKMLGIPFFLVSIAFIATKPLGSLQAVKGIAFAIFLALLVIIIGYKTHQNIYLEVWYRALKISFKRMAKNLNHVLNDEHVFYDPTVMLSINTMAEYKRIIPAQNLLNTMRVSVNARNLNMTIIYLRTVGLNKVYWNIFSQILQDFIICLEKKSEFNIERLKALEYENIHQERGYKHLKGIITNWNKICTQV